MREFFAKLSISRLSRPSKAPSSIISISFICNWSSLTFVRPSNMPLSRVRSLLDFRIILSRLARFVKTPTGIDVKGELEISKSKRFTKPSNAPASTDVRLVPMNSTFSSWELSTKAALGMVLILA